MTFDEFDELFDKLFEECKKMRDTKGKEYAMDKDRLANFKEIAEANGITALQVCNVYLTKHTRAINSFCRNNKTFSNETFKSRIIDCITYCALMYAIFLEDLETRKYFDEDEGEVKDDEKYGRFIRNLDN